MPDKETIERARKDKQEGKSPGTQAGEFVREEIDHIREGKHGARSAKQAIAIGLSKARRAGVKLPPPAKGKAPESTRKQAVREYESGKVAHPSARRSAASLKKLQKEPKAAGSHLALSRHSRQAARRRSKNSAASWSRLSACSTARSATGIERPESLA